MHPPSVSIVRLVQRGSPSVIKLSSEATTKGTYPGRLFFTQQMVHPPTPPHFLPPTLATTLADCMKVNDFKPEFFYTHVEVRLPQFIENLRIVDALKTRIIVHEEENDKRNNNQWIIPNDGEPELREPSSESLDNDRFPVEQHQDQTPVGLLCRTNWRETKKRTGKSKNPKPKYCHRKAKRLNHLRYDKTRILLLCTAVSTMSW